MSNPLYPGPEQQYPQQGYPQQGYPQQGYPQQGYGAPGGGSKNAPPSVENAVKLMFVRAGLIVFGLLLQFLTVGAQARAMGVDESVALGGAIIGVVIGLAIAGLYLFAAVEIRKGANWARIVAWVLSGLFIVGFLIGLAGVAMTAWYMLLLSLVGVVIDIAVVVLLARRDSNHYFAARH